MNDAVFNIPIKVKATEKTPSFEYIPRQGVFNIKGVSVPQDAKALFIPILEWADKFCEKQDPKMFLMINIDLDYFSATSAMFLIKIFKKFEKFKNVVINWYYEDEELKEAGDEFASFINIRFNFISKAS